MATSTEVRLMLNAVDNASKVIAGVNDNIDKMAKVSKGAGDFMAGLGININELANPAMLAGKAVAALGKYVADSTKETQNYNLEVTKLAQNLGIGTEETSRIIQAADDYGVEIGSVEQALKMALKNGFAPTIDTLAQMADKYVAIQDPTERAAVLTKVFGRNWTELVPILKQGGDAIRETAREQSAALLVTKEEAAASEQLRVAQDKLHDSKEAISHTIGNKTIPLEVRFLDALNKELDGTMNVVQANKLFWFGIDNVTDKLKEEERQTNATNRVEEIRLHSTNLVVDATENLTDAQKMNLLKQDEWGQSISEATKAVQAQADMTAGLTKRYSDMTSYMSGKLGPEIEDYKTKLGELNGKHGELVAKIEELSKKRYLTEDQKKELEDAKTALGENQTAIENLATAHDTAMKKIVYDLLVERASIDGLTTAEYNALLMTGQAFGLVDEKTAAAGGKIDDLLKQLNDNQITLDTFYRELRKILDGDYNITIHVGYNIDNVPYNPSHPGNNPNLPHPYASGGGGTIPPGYPNDSYPVWMTSGEQYTVKPTTNYNFTMNVHTNATAGTAMRDFEIMKSMTRH